MNVHFNLNRLACRAVFVCYCCLSFIGMSAGADPSARSPVDLVVTPDGKLLATCNSQSGTITIIGLADGKVLRELPAGQVPTALALSKDGQRLVVTARYSGELWIYRRVADGFKPAGSIAIGFQPWGVALTADGGTAYVARFADASVAVVSLADKIVVQAIPVGRWPRYLALSPDGRRLAVGVNAEGGVAVVDTSLGKTLFIEDFAGINLGQMQVTDDGTEVLFPWVVYRRNPITESNIQRGWVLASRLGRVRLDRHVRRHAIALDPKGTAVGDPHGLAVAPDRRFIVLSAGGTHELLVLKADGLPWQDYGGPGDHIDPALLADASRLRRIPLGGRPLGMRFGPEAHRVFVANALADSVQEVDIAAGRITRTLLLGEEAAPTSSRLGEAIFFDARRSLDQWYSCHTCHYEVGGNSVVMDTRNDGTVFTFKTVPALWNFPRTGPWTWHGWQKDPRAALEKSLKDTMLGPEPTQGDVSDLMTFLASQKQPPPTRRMNEEASAQRGAAIFHGKKANCAQCHSGELFTDGEVHDVGTGSPGDRYPGFNTPSLLGVSWRPRLLHDGRAANLRDLLSGVHRPSLVAGEADLAPNELVDLVAYLRTL